jgi:hypothetical protein
MIGKGNQSTRRKPAPSFRLLAAALCHSLTLTAEPLPVVPAGNATELNPSPQFQFLSLHLECASIESCRHSLYPYALVILL